MKKYNLTQTEYLEPGGDLRDLNILTTVKRYMDAGYSLAFIDPEIDNVIHDNKVKSHMSSLEAKEARRNGLDIKEIQMKRLKELQEYSLDIKTTVSYGRRPFHGTGLGIIYIIDLAEETHDVTEGVGSSPTM